MIPGFSIGPEVVPEWVYDAPCAKEDPHYFDALEVEDAAYALSLCSGCPFRADGRCEALVRPSTSYHDGVAAGRVWLNGEDKGRGITMRGLRSRNGRARAMEERKAARA